MILRQDVEATCKYVCSTVGQTACAPTTTTTFDSSLLAQLKKITSFYLHVCYKVHQEEFSVSLKSIRWLFIVEMKKKWDFWWSYSQWQQIPSLLQKVVNVHGRALDLSTRFCGWQGC